MAPNNNQARRSSLFMILDMKPIREKASSNGQSFPGSNGNGHAVTAAASAKTISALLARIDELESRLNKLEGLPPAVAKPLNDSNIPVVIISAVVASVLNQPHRILAIDSHPANAWALQGRMQLHQARI